MTFVEIAVKHEKKKINKTRGCGHWCGFDLHLCNFPVSGNPWEDRIKELKVKLFFPKCFQTFRASKSRKQSLTEKVLILNRSGPA